MYITIDTKLLARLLKEAGYDGLFYPGECACKIDDLAPCESESIEECKPGVLRNCAEIGVDADWCIGLRKIKEQYSLVKDKKRLDWLESQGTGKRWLCEQDAWGNYQLTETEYLGGENNVRAAIDRARPIPKDET